MTPGAVACNSCSIFWNVSGKKMFIEFKIKAYNTLVIRSSTIQTSFAKATLNTTGRACLNFLINGLGYSTCTCNRFERKYQSI